MSTLLCAKDKIEIYAGSMDSEENIVKAYGEVTVVYKEYFLTSNEAVYDRESGELQLFGNVRANKSNEYKILGEYARLNIIDKERAFKPFYLLDKETQVWISADEASGQNEELHVSSGTISGCNPNNPIWTLDFSSSIYNTESKWLNMYNARLYIYDIPVFYTPYFGHSLDNTRRSGLLFPGLGYSSDEGLYYEQPIYIAEQDWWDLELRPQIRTNRGSGIYSIFRFVDSKVSQGEFTAGYFKEKNRYFEKNNLANDSHYGFDFKYQNSNFLNHWLKIELEGQSGLFIDVTNMNDVDYINLSASDSMQNVTSSQILSRMNMFYNDDENYYGGYFKYYKNLTLDNNDNTLQKLPTLQYHRYLDTFLDEHLFYNIDIQSNNIYREINKKVTQSDINIPVTLQASLFDEYLNISYTSYIYGQYSDFSGTEQTVSGYNYEDGFFARQHNILSASTQLTRNFEEITHTIGFAVEYILDGADVSNGFYDYDNTGHEFYNINSIEELIKLNFSQYLFDPEGRQKIYHKLSQQILNERSGNEKYGDLENELDYQITDSLSLYNDMFFNYSQKKFSKIYNKLSFNGEGIDISLSHIYRDSFLPKTATYNPISSYVTSSIGYRYDDHYSYTARYDYDLELDLRKNAEIGFLYQKRCWEFGLRYAQNNRPVLQNGESSSIKDQFIYFTIIFKPFMQSGSRPLYTHQFSQDN